MTCQTFAVRGARARVRVLSATRENSRDREIVDRVGDLVEVVPLDDLPTAGGRYAWMRDVLVECVECCTPTRAGALSNQLCQECADNHKTEDDETE